MGDSRLIAGKEKQRFYSSQVDPPRGDTIWLIQINPTNNVFQGSAKRVW